MLQHVSKLSKTGKERYFGVTCVIEKPIVRMYSSGSLTGEVSDELIFGTRIEVLCSSGVSSYCRTEYGYEGYVNSWELAGEERIPESAVTMMVYSPCDVLKASEYREAPLMHLHRGSMVYVTEKENERFYRCIVLGKTAYIPCYALEKPYNGCKIGERNGSCGVEIAFFAKEYLGTPYRWGGKTEEGTDCSGLVFAAHALSGKRIYRDAVFREEYVEEVSDADVSPGDIAYFKGHAAVMLGNDSFIHASASAGRVVIGSFENGDLDRRGVLCFARVKSSK